MGSIKRWREHSEHAAATQEETRHETALLDHPRILAPTTDFITSLGQSAMVRKRDKNWGSARSITSRHILEPPQKRLYPGGGDMARPLSEGTNGYCQTGDGAL